MMGGFGCRCGESIDDGTDYLPYKAHLLADQDMEDFYEASAASQPRAAYELIKATVYQCPACHRLLFITAGGGYHSFKPDEKSPGMLVSAKGEGWRRILRGSWSDAEKKGYVYWGDSGMGPGDHGHASFTTREDVEKLYYEVFERLSKAGKLRSAFLRINGGTPQRVDVHGWSYTPDWK